MNWKLFDPKVGRANRGQFWTALIIAVLLIIIANKLPYLFMQVPLIILSVFISTLVATRRLHDLNLDPYDEMGMADLSDPIATAKFHLPKPRFHLPILFIWFLFVSGDKLKNDYGYPPEGINPFNMIAKNYSSNQIKEIENAQKTMHKNRQKIHKHTQKNAQPTEFKGRKI